MGTKTEHIARNIMVTRCEKFLFIKYKIVYHTSIRKNINEEVSMKMLYQWLLARYPISFFCISQRSVLFEPRGRVAQGMTKISLQNQVLLCALMSSSQINSSNFEIWYREGPQKLKILSFLYLSKNIFWIESQFCRQKLHPI